ncbi:hypothetical protein [Streptomyces alanosinicus]|uniref:Uncharacterized protein n=1 Tax=Streptomyces alanosinicus TaxID=68171 RepID=A0A918YDY3_9ACTN|nr:hypothetical protein [Streptomyces alanosinicus]GHE00417.1 hypothetical protein GCM10010339_15510 [Streptomyces alanosinicus]
MSDANDKPVVKPDNTHITEAEAGTEVKPLNTHITDAPAGSGIKPMNTHITDAPAAAAAEAKVIGDNTHITSDPS